jgi:hypothetical protein
MRYWIPSPMPLVREVVRNCITCKKKN